MTLHCTKNSFIIVDCLDLTQGNLNFQTCMFRKIVTCYFLFFFSAIVIKKPRFMKHHYPFTLYFIKKFHLFNSFYRLQCWDCGVQEYLLYCLGCWRSGQNPAAVETLLHKHTGEYFVLLKLQVHVVRQIPLSFCLERYERVKNSALIQLLNSLLNMYKLHLHILHVCRCMLCFAANCSKHI